MALQICTLLLKKEGLCEKHEDYYFTAAFVHVFFFYIIFPFFFKFFFFLHICYRVSLMSQGGCWPRCCTVNAIF